MRPRHRCGSVIARPGIIIVIALFATPLIGGIFAHVINVGRHSARRVLTQHTADATAQAGAGWVARQLNTVSMNNVAMTRLVALVPVLDAIPQATQFAYEDQKAFHDAIDGQLKRGVGDNRWLDDSLIAMRGNFRAELDILEPMHNHFNGGGFDMTTMTHYDKDGDIWRAMFALDQYNQVTMANIGPLAQLNAIRGGEVNFADDNERGASMIVPILPQVPHERGYFDDFNYPVRAGILPKRFGKNNIRVDDKTTNRGPWDVLYGWRYPVAGQVHGYHVPGKRIASMARGGKGSVPIGRGARGGNITVGGKFVVTAREPDRYGVHSEYDKMKHRTGSFSHNHLRRSRFGRYANDLADIKMSYAWPGRPIQRYLDPQWILDFDKAMKYGDDPNLKKRIVETAFVGAELKSKYPPGHSSFLTPGTFKAVVKSGREDNPFLVRHGGFLDPRPWDQYPNVTKIADHIWRDEWVYYVYFDHEIGIKPQRDTTGKRIEHPVYRIDDFVFLGINVGPHVNIENPFGQASRNKRTSGPPAPMDLDHREFKGKRIAAGREYLTYLAVARREENPLMWAKRFHGGKPDAGDSDNGSMYAIAQAHVFNNHSFDLWTQMWHAQLQVIERPNQYNYQNWVNRMSYGAGDVGNAPRLSGSDYQQALEYLIAVEPMAEWSLKH